MILSYSLKTEYDEETGEVKERKAYLVYKPEKSYVSVDAYTGKVYFERNTWKVNESAKNLAGGGSSSGNGKYENAESSRVDYVTGTLMPDTTALETAMRPVLKAMNQDSLYIKFDLNGLMRGDKASQGQFYREMVYMGAMTRAEVREKEDLNPIPGLEKPLIPVNYGILEPDGHVTILSTKEPSDGMQTGTTD